MMAAPRRYSYESVAWCYDPLARVYSLGRIDRAKAFSASRFGPGDRVLYAGIGTGADALRAARRGVEITGLDLSPAMLARTRRRFEAASVPVRLECKDLFEYTAERAYDAVVANFVLDVHGNEDAARAISHLATLVRVGGTLAIADFAAADPSSRNGGRPGRLVAGAYYRAVNLAGWALGLSRLHAAGDYARQLEQVGFEVVSRRGFLHLPGGRPLYETWIGVKGREI